MDFITPNTIPTPKGHYSPGVVHNGTVYVAGQLPLNEKGEAQLGSIEQQTAQCLRNMEQVLLAAGSSLQRIIKVNIFISDIALWPAVNAEYKKIMGDHKPARIVIPCNPLNYGCAIEMDCIAALNE